MDLLYSNYDDDPDDYFNNNNLSVNYFTNPDADPNSYSWRLNASYNSWRYYNCNANRWLCDWRGGFFL